MHKAQDPKSCASTSSATLAWNSTYYNSTYYIGAILFGQWGKKAKE